VHALRRQLVCGNRKLNKLLNMRCGHGNLCAGLDLVLRLRRQLVCGNRKLNKLLNMRCGHGNLCAGLDLVLRLRRQLLLQRDF